MNVASGTPVSCTIYNRSDQEADVTVDKVWDVDGIEYPDPDRPDGLDATATLTGPGGADAGPQPWGEVRTGYIVGESITVDESVTLADDTCRLTDSTIRAEGADTAEPLPYTGELASEHNRFEVRNTVECGALLTLVKRVDNTAGGDARPTDWRLTATGPDTVSGVSGTDGVTDALVTPGDYQLSETDGPSDYRAGDWECADESGPITMDGDVVPVGRGRHVTCRIDNVAVGALRPVLPITGDHLAVTLAGTAAGGLLVAAVLFGVTRRRRRA